MKRVIKSSSTRDRIADLEDQIDILESHIENREYADEDELVDMQIRLGELKEQLNFAWQDDEAEWNYAREQQEFNPDGSLKLYGSTQLIRASYEDRFWKLHDRDYQTGSALEDIIIDMGMLSKFFPDNENEEPTATEQDYFAVLDAFGDAEVDISDVVERTIQALAKIPGVRAAHYEPEVDAIRFRFKNGKEFQFVIQQLHF